MKAAKVEREGEGRRGFRYRERLEARGGGKEGRRRAVKEEEVFLGKEEVQVLPLTPATSPKRESGGKRKRHSHTATKKKKREGAV